MKVHWGAIASSIGIVGVLAAVFVGMVVALKPEPDKAANPAHVVQVPAVPAQIPDDRPPQVIALEKELGVPLEYETGRELYVRDGYEFYIHTPSSWGGIKISTLDHTLDDAVANLKREYRTELYKKQHPEVSQDSWYKREEKQQEHDRAAEWDRRHGKEVSK